MKKQTRALNEKQENRVRELIEEAHKDALGDMAEYLSYLNDRLSAVEDKLNMPVLDYEEELAARYGSELRRKGAGG
jgi:hypothetical protein